MSGLSHAVTRARIALRLLVVLQGMTLGGGVARAESPCVDCHWTRAEARLRAPTSARADAHGRHEVGCRDCHGGARTASAGAHDPGLGFVGRPDALGVISMCGHCHDGSTTAPAVMADFRAGAHGSAVAAGEPGATCTSCHRPHAIEPLAASDAPELCASCHADAERMEGTNLPTDQLAQWSQSVHGRLAAAGSQRAPTCVGCHEPHRNAAGLAATAACGRCHVEVHEAFEHGPHADAFARLGFLDCVECHGSHEVAVLDERMLWDLGAVCVRCHGPGQPALARVEALASLGPRIRAARGVVARDDPKRRAMIRAIHALDVEGLEHALDEIAEPQPGVPLAPTRTRARPLWRGAWVVGAVGLLLIVVVGMARWRRRKR